MYWMLLTSARLPLLAGMQPMRLTDTTWNLNVDAMSCVEASVNKYCQHYWIFESLEDAQLLEKVLKDQNPFEQSFPPLFFTIRMLPSLRSHKK